MDQAIQAEKQRTAELERKLRELEAQMKSKEERAVAPPPPPAPEKSRLESLVEDALSRMASLEVKMKESETTEKKPVDSMVTAAEKKGKEKKKQATPPESESEGEGDDDVDEATNDEDDYVTTPNGLQVPLTKYI